MRSGVERHWLPSLKKKCPRLLERLELEFLAELCPSGACADTDFLLKDYFLPLSSLESMNESGGDYMERESCPLSPRERTLLGWILILNQTQSQSSLMNRGNELALCLESRVNEVRSGSFSIVLRGILRNRLVNELVRRWLCTVVQFLRDNLSVDDSPFRQKVLHEFNMYEETSCVLCTLSYITSGST